MSPGKPILIPAFAFSENAQTNAITKFFIYYLVVFNLIRLKYSSLFDMSNRCKYLIK
ncbi:hypothetical protein [Halobacteriovorax sp. Y22]|uniref:hypothetical protein n=1 Tax=Halobacteriovorax sp. Y22 TaxID=2505978 RepID=UPI00351A3067